MGRATGYKAGLDGNGRSLVGGEQGSRGRLLEGGRGSVPALIASAVAAGSVRPSPSREGRGRRAGAGLGSSGA